MTTHRLAIIPGDGVGREVVPEGLRAVRAAAEVTGSFDIETVDYPWSCEYYAQHGRMMDDDALDRLRDSDAIYLGAIGFPGVPDHISLWDDAAADPPAARPVHQPAADHAAARASTGRCATAGPEDIDFICIRENTEGEYCGIGGRLRKGTPDEVVMQTAMFTRKGTERVVRYAFDLAMKRKRALVSGHQVERAEPLDGLLGRGRGGGRQGLPRGDASRASTSTRWRRASCSILSSSTSSSRATCSATS